MAQANTDLRRRIASGNYLIDPRAVAEAMLRHYLRVASGSFGGMPVSGEVERLVLRPEHGDPAAGRGGA
jgi:hypothetical protein